ncbi:MAG: IPT/TIG domain-containing protein [Calditrichaeota bacterium]|nr:IPT/TIG domain-containing protein [Calditrichota bacterium]
MNLKLSCVLCLSIALSVVSSFAEPSRPVPKQTPPPSTPVRSPISTIVSIPWTDDFESGGLDWTTSGFFHVVEDPQLQPVLNPTINPVMVSLPDEGFLPLAHNGTRAMWYGEAPTGSFIGADFNPNQGSHSGGTSNGPNTGWAITPEIDLTNASAATLDFWTWWEIEGVDVPFFDLMFVEATIDGGITWAPVGSGLLNPLDDVNANAHVGYSSGGVGEPGLWIHHVFQMDQFIGSLCAIRFRFNTGDNLYNGFRGWLIDEVSVTGISSPAPDISHLQPNRGDRDNLIHVHGSDFRSGAQFFIGDELCVSVVLSEDLAQIIVPNMRRDIYNVTVINPDGLSGGCNFCFTVDNVQPPEIQVVTPTWTYIDVPRTITVLGERFNPGAVVTVGGLPVSNLNIINDQTMTFTTPDGIGLGARPIRITNTDGLFDLCSGCMEIRPWAFVTAPDSLVIQAEPPHIVLHWAAADTVMQYGVFESDALTGEFSVLKAATPATSYVDSFATESADEQRIYVVKAFAP